MKADYLNALLLAVDSGQFLPPQRDERWIVLNGRLLPANPFKESEVVFEQGFRPEFLRLQENGFSAKPRVSGWQEFDHAVVLAGRIRAVNEANLARAWNMIRAGGRIVVAGAKTSGIASLRKWAARQVEIAGSFSKYHALVFWLEKKLDDQEIAAPPAKPVFSGGSTDKGSELLSRHFNERITGKVADFGAGSGYLTAQLLARSPHLDSVDLLEAEWSALEIARRLLEDSKISTKFHWIDIVDELEKKPYEWIVMNPPFHHGLHGGRQSDPGLGRQFIQRAASTLVQGGKLLMVANRNLPYEETLSAVFRRHEKLAEKNGYKVLEAVR